MPKQSNLVQIVFRSRWMVVGMELRSAQGFTSEVMVEVRSNKVHHLRRLCQSTACANVLDQSSCDNASLRLFSTLIARQYDGARNLQIPTRSTSSSVISSPRRS